MANRLLYNISDDALSGILSCLPFRCAMHLLNTGNRMMRAKVLASFVHTVELRNEADYRAYMQLCVHHKNKAYFQQIRRVRMLLTGKGDDKTVRTLSDDVLPPFLETLCASQFNLSLSNPFPTLASIKVASLHTAHPLSSVNELSVPGDCRLGTNTAVSSYTVLSDLCNFQVLTTLRIQDALALLYVKGAEWQWHVMPCLKVLHIDHCTPTSRPPNMALAFPSLEDLSIPFDAKTSHERWDLSEFHGLKQLCVTCKNKLSVENCFLGFILFPPNIVRLALAADVHRYDLSLHFFTHMLGSLPKCVCELVMPTSAPDFFSKMQFKRCERIWTRVIWRDDEWYGEKLSSLCDQVAARKEFEDHGDANCLEPLSKFALRYNTMTDASYSKMCTYLIGHIFEVNPAAGVYMTRHVTHPSQLNWAKIDNFSPGEVVVWINNLTMDDEAEETCMLAHLLLCARYIQLSQIQNMLAHTARRERPGILRRMCQLLWLMSFNVDDPGLAAWSIFTREYGREVIGLLSEDAHYREQIESITAIAKEVPLTAWSLQNNVFQCTEPHLMASALYMMDHPEWADAACRGKVRSAWFHAYPKWRNARVICEALKSHDVPIPSGDVYASYYDATIVKIKTQSLQTRGCSLLTLSEHDLVCSSLVTVAQRRWPMPTHVSMEDFVAYIKVIVSEIVKEDVPTQM